MKEIFDPRLDATILRLERLIAPEPEYGDQDEFYRYEPLPVGVFLDGLASLGEPVGSFCDLGCGIGTKLALAYETGWNVYGCDTDAEYVRVARRLVPEAVVEEADARHVPVDSYDVVYMYHLARDRETEARLEREIVGKMRPGALAFFPHAIEMIEQDRVSEHVWRVG